MSNSDISHARLLRGQVLDLDVLTAQSRTIDGVWKAGLEWGDQVTIVTLNSVYTLCAIGDDRFMASGGWFDRKSEGPTEISVSGCSWGGSAINRKLVAAPGLHVEFGNGVVTTRIQRVIVERHSEAEIEN